MMDDVIMGKQREVWIILVMAISIAMSKVTIGKRYRVGDSVWSIPISPEFYSIWSSSFLFYVGDSLVFEFESEFFNVIQVPRLDYDSCTSWAPIKILTASPAIVLLNEEGVFYYICNISNYCDLGQKITIVVHSHSSPTPSPSPASLWMAPAPAPIRAPTPALAPDPSDGLDSGAVPSPVILNNNGNPNWDSDANRIRFGFVSIWFGLEIVFWM